MRARAAHGGHPHYPLISQDTGVFSAKPQTRAMHEAMVTDPSVMADMMKKNLTGMVPQGGGGGAAAPRRARGRNGPSRPPEFLLCGGSARSRLDCAGSVWGCWQQEGGGGKRCLRAAVCGHLSPQRLHDRPGTLVPQPSPDVFPLAPFPLHLAPLHLSPISGGDLARS